MSKHRHGKLLDVVRDDIAAVAIVLGAIVLDEKITAVTIAGFFLVLGGCWLATRPDRAPARGVVDVEPAR